MNFTPRDVARADLRHAERGDGGPGWRERDPAAFDYCMSFDLEAPPRRFAVERQRGAMAQWSSHDRLSAIAVPRSYSAARTMGWSRPRTAGSSPAAIPAARCSSFPSGGHLAMLEQPETVAKAVFDFLGV